MVHIISAIIQIILLLFGTAILSISLVYKMLPRGVIEWIILCVDVGIVISWFI